MPYIKIGSIIAGCIAVVAVAAIIFINVTRPKPLPEDITPGSDGAAEITNDAQKFSISLWINLVIKPQKLMKYQN